MTRFLVPLLVLGGAGVCLWSMIAPEDLGLVWFPREMTRGGEAVDRLIDEIALVMGGILVLTSLLLAWAVLRGAGRRADEGSSRAGSLPLELVWTVIPAAILGWLFVRQLEVRDVLADEGERAPFVLGVDAHQFEWRFRYAGEDGEVWTADDVVTLHEAALPVGRPIELRMRSRDVIHSFFAPALRVKRDVVPGRETPLRFTLDAADLASAGADLERGHVLGLECAELCGWGHAAMIGRLRALSDDALDAWILARSEARREVD